MSDPLAVRLRQQFDNLRHGHDLNEGVIRGSASAHRFKPPARAEERVLTIMFTDIVGSTESAAREGDRAWQRRLAAHDKLIIERLAAHRGIAVKRTGDGFLAVFETPSAAALCGQQLAREVVSLGVTIRIGVHLGQVMFSQRDVEGSSVNLAARVMGHARASEVLITRAVRDATTGGQLELDRPRLRRLKGFKGVWLLYPIRALH
jgi:class 3 adenylate cyclase